MGEVFGACATLAMGWTGLAVPPGPLPAFGFTSSIQESPKPIVSSCTPFRSLLHPCLVNLRKKKDESVVSVLISLYLV